MGFLFMVLLCVIYPPAIPFVISYYAVMFAIGFAIGDK